MSGGVDANADSLIRTFEYMYGDETLERITNEWVAAPHSYKTCEYLPNAMALVYNDTDQTLNVLEALPYYYRAVNIGPDNNATPSFDGQKIESLADVISVYGDPVSASCKGSAFLYYVWTFGEDSAIIAECTPPMKLLPDGRLNEMHYIRYNHIPIEGDDYGPTYENILAVLADMGLYDAPVE